MNDRSKPHPEFTLVGTPHRKPDGLPKATGEAVYTDDLALPGMLHGKTLRSPHAHARIVKVDVSRALALPGVHAVITGADLPTKYGVLPWTQDETALAVDRARFVGDPVAAVAAIDEDTAIDALEAIDVEYEVLPALLDPEAAMARDDVRIHEKAEHNVHKHVRLEFGDVDGALKGGDVAVEGDYFFHGTTHAAIEPHCAVARMSPDGVLTVWSSTQITHYVQIALARVLGLPMSRIRVIQPTLGGAFGGKSDPFSLEFCAAKLAMITGRPVKFLWTREEIFYSHRGRHPMRMHYRTAATRDGKLTAVDGKLTIDGGAYSSFGLVTTYYAGQLLTGPYHFPTYRFDATRVFTNKPPCGPKRGHGSVQPRFAFEVQLDELAEKLALDPIELRRKNWQGDYTKTVNGQRITSSGFGQCLDAVELASEWTKRRAKLPFGHGLGVAGSMYISGTNYPIHPNEMPQSGVQLKVDRSGLVTAFIGGNDIGQGSSSTMRTLIAETVGLALDDVRVVAADSDLCPVDLGAYSSRVTFMLGNAAISAAKQLREAVMGAVAKKLNVAVDRLTMTNGVLINGEDPAKPMTSREALNIAEETLGTLGTTGGYKTPKLGGDYRGGTIGASPAYSFTAHVAEVSVDPETGIVRCEKIWVAHDCGRALNPVLVAGQMEGSAYMGAAEALLEDHDVDEHGLHRGPSLLDYPIPTTLDTPELQALIIESIDPEGPYGAKEAGEGPLHPAIPAIGNAIFDAVGIRLHDLPFTPGKVLKALREQAAAVKARRGRAC